MAVLLLGLAMASEVQGSDLHGPDARLLFASVSRDTLDVIGFPGAVPSEAMVVVISDGIHTTLRAGTTGSFLARQRLPSSRSVFISFEDYTGRTSRETELPIALPSLTKRAFLDHHGDPTVIPWYDIVVASADTAELRQRRQISLKETQGGLPDSLMLGTNGYAREPLRFYGRNHADGSITVIVRESGASFTERVSAIGAFDIEVPLDAMPENTHQFVINATNEAGELTHSLGMSLMPQEYHIQDLKKERESRALIGKLAPSVSLQRFDSQESVNLQPAKGDVTVIVTWASWCAPCKPEMQMLADLADSLDATIYSITVDRNMEDARKAVAEWPIDFPVFVDSSYIMKRNYAAYAIPHTVVIDRRGRVNTAKVGIMSRLKLQRAVASANDAE